VLWGAGQGKASLSRSHGDSLTVRSMVFIFPFWTVPVFDWWPGMRRTEAERDGRARPVIGGWESWGASFSRLWRSSHGSCKEGGRNDPAARPYLVAQITIRFCAGLVTALLLIKA
jgi:hypothetical protein